MDLFTVSSQNEPVVMIHRGWKDIEGSKDFTSRNDYSYQPRTGNFYLQTKAYDQENETTTKSIHQKFEFINATNTSKNTDPEIKKLVRAHVVRDSSRRKKALTLKSKHPLPSQHKNTPSDSKPETINSSNITTSTESNQANSPNSIFHWLDPHPALSHTIYYISAVGSLMWPLESSFYFNPVSPVGWFDWALGDEALFHALLYTTATYAGLVGGTTESKEAVLHAGISMKLIRERLEKRGVEEGIIGAVSCLALTEALRGDFVKWRIHMRGIRQMVDLQGGISKLNMTLQLKIYRADLTGSISSLGTPFFPDLNTLPATSIMPPFGGQDRNLLKYLSSLTISPSLIKTLLSLSQFSHTISSFLCHKTPASIPSQIALLKHTYTLRYSLLAPSLSFSMWEEVLHLAAHLFIQVTLQEFSSAAIGSRKLVERLVELVTGVKIRNEREGEMLVWVLVLGGIEVDAEGIGWFVDQLGRLTRRLGFGRGWKEIKAVLERLWWVEEILDIRGRKLWGEVEASYERDAVEV